MRRWWNEGLEKRIRARYVMGGTYSALNARRCVPKGESRLLRCDRCLTINRRIRVHEVEPYTDEVDKVVPPGLYFHCSGCLSVISERRSTAMERMRFPAMFDVHGNRKARIDDGQKFWGEQP